ncbi:MULTISPECIES: CHAT domain-containing protein [Streptomyces]|uniref:CHAT domain-containing protein n=1 Tax=Streptomyces koelreuteriae TaxID=2838015 RepID=A0ABX8G1X9_9ACTN|nr:MULTISPECIES: CHAT domain-containing protein [Streptomyces]QWB27520.1 CHAT domain-containing protein [Streptomyces koelreuteriae]UUA10610.1 CHAT domain-containing protein [Streptomyces koelreuteriae]UUA18217.1 CHAT domain-containing protein [Streptomyces sp. CRCS-T-1]
MLPQDALFEAVMRRRARDGAPERWREALAGSAAPPLRLRWARRSNLFAMITPPVAVPLLPTLPAPLFPLAMVCAVLISLRMALSTWATRELLRPALLRRRLRPLAVVPAVAVAATPPGEWLADVWSSVPVLTGVGGGVLLAGATVIGLALAASAPHVPSKGGQLLLRAPRVVLGRGSMMFLLAGVFQPRRELLVATVFVLAVEVLAAWAMGRVDRSLLWRPAWARLRGGSGPAYDSALASWAFDRVLARPIGPDYRAVVALTTYAWQSYRGALTEKTRDVRTDFLLHEGAQETLEWLILADNALLAVEMNADAVLRGARPSMLRAHLTATVLVQATAVVTWGNLDRPEEAHEEARGAAQDFGLLGKPQWAELYRVCAAAVSARRGDNPNRAAAELRALLRERTAAGRHDGPAQHNAILTAAMVAHHVTMREEALELLASLRGLPADGGLADLETDGMTPWVAGALWDAAVYDVNRYFVERDLREASGGPSYFRTAQSTKGVELTPGTGRRLTEDVAEVRTPPGEGPADVTRRALVVLERIIERYGPDQPGTRIERQHMSAAESMMALGESVHALDRLHDQIDRSLRSMGKTPAPRSPAPPGPSGLAAKRLYAGETLRLLLSDPDTDSGLRKAFSHTENVRAMKLSAELARRTMADGPKAPPSSLYQRQDRHASPARAVLTPQAIARARTGSLGHAELNRQRGVSEFGQVSELLATIGPETLLMAYWHDEDETLVFLLRADDSAPRLVTIAHTPADHAALRDALRGIEPDDRHLAPTPWDTPFRPLVEAAVRHSRPGETVWLVPDGLLHHVPLHAVGLPDGGALSDRNPVCFSPSASLMRLCLGDAEPPATPASALLIADRTSEDALVFASLETHAVTAHLPDATTVSGKRQLLAQLSARPYDVLHLACHGEFRPGRHETSAVVLGRDERLTAYDVVDLRLRVGLVTIGACESGLGSLDLAEERFGLVRAFLQAGARSVLATLWKVDDLSAALLLDDFYARLSRGVARAEALRQAQLALRRTPARAVRQYCLSKRPLVVAPEERAELDQVLSGLDELPPDRLVFDDPYHWAPFQLYGDWR